MAIIDKRFLYYTTEAGFLKDKKEGKIDSKSVVFLSENGKRTIYTHGKFFNPEVFVVGTQSSSTNAFTGVFNEIDGLYDGLNIRYWLPYNGTSSAATLNLTIGDTTTGAIPVYIKGTTRFTNHIGGTNVLDLTYRENVGGIEKGWWVLGSYGDVSDGNTAYTFTSGSDGSFKVKPSNGSEQIVSIGKPSTAGTADKVGKNFVVQVNSGEEEYVSMYTYDGSEPKTINIIQGSNISFGVEDGELTINGDYKNATPTSSGLMSFDDKEKLDGIEEGANNYEHPSYTEYASGLYKITVDAEGHVESVTNVVKSDITSLGIPAQDTHYESKNIVGSTATSTTNTTSVLSNGSVYLNSIENDIVTSSHKISGKGATTVETDASGNIEINSPTTIAWGNVTGKPETFTPSGHEHIVSDITDFPETQELSVNGTTYDVYTSETSLPNFYAPSTLGTNGQVLKSDGTKLVWGKDDNDNTWRGITLTDGITDTSVLGTGTDTGALKFKAGNNVSLSASDGVITVSATDTTYDLATSSEAGIVTIGTATAKANGTASAGTTTGGKAAAVDHVHPLQTSVSGNAGTATKLASKVDITLGGDVTGTAEFDGSDDITITTTVGNDSHNHSNSTITSVDASKITSGTISIDRLPHGALERLTVVANDTARFALTTNSVQLGDTVKVTETGLMYFVKDTANLANENGYEIYTAGRATSVPWSGITGKPTEFTPSTHDHNAATQSVSGFMSAADKKKLDGIATGANKYTLPEATTSVLGGIKIAKDNALYTVATNTSSISGNIESGKYYGVELDSSGKAFVHVPWIDYSAGTGISFNGTTINNSGVRSISTGDNNGTIKVNTGGIETNVSVNGLGSAAYTDTSAYATAGHSHNVATTSAKGFMSSDDKTKLDYTNIAYGTCSTAAAIAAKEITISGNSKWLLTAGSVIVIKFSYTNSASNPTFNVNGTGAKSVWYNTALITTGSLGMAGTANRPMQFMYDGTRFVFVGWSYDTNSTYSTYSLGIGYGTCATAAGTVAKVVTLSNYTLVTGGIVSVKFDNNVPASATMNINSRGAKAIYHRGAAIAAGVIEAGDIATFIYSTNYHLIAIDRATSKATQNVDGLMSSEDKTKLDGIATGATANKGTVTSVTISAGDGIAISSTEAITTSGTRTISLSESGVTVNTDGTAKTYGNTAQQSPGHSGTFNIPYFTVDKYGRITAASTTTVKLPASGNTDEKVKQSSSTTNYELPLLVGTIETPTSGNAYGAYYNTGVTMNPSTKTITATTFSGNATSATKLQTARTIDGVDFNGTAAITHYGTCSTPATTAEKTVSLTGFKLVTGSRIAIKFTVNNIAANPTLNVNSTGARAIMYRGSAISAGYLAANRVYEFIYDGTDYELVGDVNTNTTYSGDRGISLVSEKFGHSNTKITEKTAFVDTDDSISVSSNDGSFKVTDIKYDAYGHITGSQDRTITLSEPHKGTVTSVTIKGDTGISVDNSNAITSSGTRIISLNTATTDEIGGMMASNALTTEVTLTSGNGTTANRYYGVQVDKNGKAFVNIPWTDGTYTSAYSPTAAGTAAKTASCTNYTLKNNSWLHVTIVNSNTSQGAITLNVNSKGAKPIYINGIASSSSNYTLPAGTYLVYYDGTAYQFNTNGILPGTSSKASTLATSRILTIGSTGKDFNGSANVSWSLSEIGAAASSHKHAYTDLTGSGTTANQAIVSSGTADGWNLYTLGSAAEKTASTSISSNSTDNQVPTAKAVYTAITTGIKANDAMVFKGTLGTSDDGGTVSALPATHNVGWTYRVVTEGTYAGNVCEVGDLIICITDGTAASDAHWTVAQTNIDGAVTGPTSATNNHVVVFNGTSGRVIKSSGFTLGCSVPANAKFTDTTYTLSSFGITATSTELNYCDGVTSNIQTQLNGKASTSHNHDSVYLKLSGGTISSSSYGPLIIKRSGSNNMAAIKFENDLGALGSIGMNAVDGNLIRYNAATSASYNILDSSNSSVSLSGSTLTVKINGTSCSLTNTNTDTKIKQTSSTTNAAYPILTATATSPTSGTAYESYYNTGVTINPNTKTVTATTFNGNATSASKLKTACTVSLTGDVTGSTTFDGSKDISITATVSNNSHNHSSSTITSVKDNVISWAADAISGDVSPIDCAASYLHSANRAQFAKAAGIIIEYSTDGGSTWVDYGATDAQKIGLFSGINQEFRLGKGLSTLVTSSDKLRFTLNATNMGIYTLATSLLVNLSTNGSNGTTVKIETSKKGSETTFTTKYESLAVSGWSGWNRIPLNFPWGGGSNQTSNTAVIRLTFSTTGPNSSSTSKAHMYIINMIVLGKTYWTYPHTMAKTGHLYSWDASGNATFGNKVTANSFAGAGSELTSLNASNISSGTIGSARLPDATTSAKGAMTTAMVTKLNGIETGATKVVESTVSGWGFTKNTGTVTSVTLTQGTGITVSNSGTAITTTGSRTITLNTSKTDTIGGIKIGYPSSGANVAVQLSNEQAYVSLSKTAVTTALGYTPPTTNTTYDVGDYDTSGLIKPWKSYTKASTGPTAATSETAVAVNGITTTSGRYYAVEMDSVGRAFVNVPWTDNNTDTKVTQTSSTTNADYPILTATASSPTSGTAYESYYNTGVTINPNTKTVTATTFSGTLSGNASSATYASNIRVTATTSSNTYYPMWTTGTLASTNYVLRGNSNFRYNIVAGTTSAQGYDSIYLGNSTPSGTAGNSTGRILLYSSSTSYHLLIGTATTSVITHTLPATTGTILNTGTTSITAVQTSGAHIATLKINGTDTKLYAPSNPSLALGTTVTTSTAGTLVSSVAVSGHTVTMTKYNGTIGSTTKPAYFNAGVPTVCSTYAGGTKVTFNGADKGASTASFYAPTAAGTSGQVLVSSGGAPGWKDFDEVGLKTGTVTQAITTSWKNIVTAANMATYCPEAGTYAIQVSGSSIGISSGIFSWNSSGSTNDEILLHRTGASTNIYLRLSSRALQIAGSAAVASGSISIKVKRLI